MNRRSLLLLVPLLGIALPLLRSAEKPPAFLDLDGRRHSALETSNQTATVLLFVQPDCPISNQYVPVMNRLHQAFKPRKVAFRLVYADPAVTRAEVRAHRKEYRLELPALLDPEHVLVRQTGASVTPEAVVLDAEGRRVYRGRIDNRYVDFGRKRPRATRHDLKETLQALLKGRPIPQAETKAVGCYIDKGRRTP